jgi:hypothetical protein
MNDLDNLAKLLLALKPWMGRLVVAGGWAHRLYRFAPQVNKPEYQPVHTRETDLALEINEPLEGDIKDALLKAGFKEHLTGESHPPVAQYTLGDADQGFYAEFLTPLQGSGTKRNGEADNTVCVAGVSAQKLRFLEILFMSPTTINVSKENHVPLPEPMDVQVPNPVSYIVQKLLIQKYRKAHKCAQDVLYIYDTLQLFGTQFRQLNEIWTETVQPQLSRSLQDEVLRLAKAMFSTVSDTIREAAIIPQDRRLFPEDLKNACQIALEEVLACPNRRGSPRHV